MNNPIMTFLPGGVDACALYRMYMPHMNIRNSRFLYNDGNLPMSELVDSDLLLVQRLMSDKNYEALCKFEQIGLKVAYDLDDNLWEAPAYNPAARLLRLVKEGFGVCASKCSVIVTSTNHLKAAVKKHIGKQIKGKEVIAIPNAIDLNLFHPLPKKESEFVTVGWFGTNTHTGDVEAVFSMFPELLERCPTMRLMIVGLPAPGPLQSHPRVINHDFVPVSEYASRLASWRCDILLVPLLDNSFNRSKSNIKLIEAGALGMAALASPVGPYLDFVRKDKELDWILCKTNGQWKEKIVTLINDAARREHIAGRMRAVVEEHYNIATVKDQWLELLKWLR